MSETRPAVAGHYHRPGLYDTIVAALRQAGKDLDTLTPDDLAPVDEFHTRGHAVTVELAGLLGLKGGERIVDVGCGIGGPSRWLAKTFGCSVSGIDLTDEFCRTAEALSRLLKLDALTSFRQGDALHMPFPEASFDVAWSENVAMNIADRSALYREVRRVLKPGGRYGFADIVSLSGAPLHFPVPWASEPGLSFLLTPQATRQAVEGAGFRVLAWEDTTAKAIDAARQRTQAGAAPQPLNLQYVMGPDFRIRVKNAARNLEEGRTGSIQAVVQRTD